MTRRSEGFSLPTSAPLPLLQFPPHSHSLTPSHLPFALKRGSEVVRGRILAFYIVISEFQQVFGERKLIACPCRHEKQLKIRVVEIFVQKYSFLKL
jgi:hypothetical protein